MAWNYGQNSNQRQYTSRASVLGVGFDNLTLEEAAAVDTALVEAGGFHCTVTPDPEFLPAARHNPAFRQALLGADLVLADGVGVVRSVRILGRPLEGRASSIDFAQWPLAWMTRHGKRLFLLGVKPGATELATVNLKDTHSDLTVYGTHDGYLRENGPVVGEVGAAAADVMFVCLGAPKQELRMVEHGPTAGAHLMVGLGGSLDVSADVVKRAPEGFQRLGLEWLYRLVKEPKHIKHMTKLPLMSVQAAGARLRGKWACRES